MSHDAVQWIE